MSILSVLLEITIYSVLIFCVVMLFKKLFGKHISASLHYFIWLLLVVRLIMPVTIDSGFNLFSIPANSLPVNVYFHPPAADTAHIDGTIPNENIDKAPHNTAAIVAKRSSAVQAEPSTTTPFNWRALLLYIWIAGVALSVLYLFWSYLYLKKRIGKSAVFADKALSDIFQQCVRELGIKRNIRMVLQNEIGSPALLVFPVMLIPVDITRTMNKQQIAFAIKHELMHYKRKDYIACLLLSLLQAVYWFNPFVWLAYRQIRRDMETACDSMVVKTMDSAEKLKYAATVLSLFSRKKQLPVMLGMAVVNTKKTAEKRIKGIYMKQKSNPKGRLAAAVLACVMIIICFTTACQPTPEEEIVVNKNDESILNTVQQSSAVTGTNIRENLNIPEHYTHEAQNESGLIQLSVDANIKVPNIASIPVNRIQMHAFSQEEVNILIETLMRGEPVYETPEEPTFTKEQLQQRIIETLQILAGDDYYGRTREEWEKDLSWYQERVEDAPDTMGDVQLTPSDGKLIIGDPNGVRFDEEYLNVITYLGGTSMSKFRVENNSGYNNYSVYFDSGISDDSHDIVPLTITQEQASEQVEALFQKLGYKDFVLNNSIKDSSSPEHEMWELQYVRQYNGVLVSKEREGKDSDDPSYAPSWSAEMIQVQVDDTGIEMLNWSNPYEITEEVMPSANLQSFEKIQQRFEEMFFVMNTDEGQFDKGTEYTIKFVVNRIELELMRINEKDSADTGLLVPVWIFYGNTQDNHANPEGELSATIGGADLVIMKINAIDGSIIN